MESAPVRGSRGARATLSLLLLVGFLCWGCGESSSMGAGGAPGEGGAGGAPAGEGGAGGSPVDPGACTLAADAEAPPFVRRLGCAADFTALASEPLSTAIPGARSAKVVWDRFDEQFYVQNSTTYPIHHAFVSAHLSGGERPFVPALAAFNTTEYASPDRRFLLGALTHYAGPDVYALEFSPYDTADADMAKTLFDAVQAATPFVEVRFHPTSEQVTQNTAAAELPTITNEELFAGIDYQPLNLARSMGRLRFVLAEDLDDTYLDFRDIVVLDKVPNDISVVLGLITQEFQTPLSHVNVLSQNRKTPNMALRNALTNPELRALDGKYVELDVGAFKYTVREVTQAEADAWFEAHRPERVAVPALDLSLEAVTPIGEALDTDIEGMRERIKDRIPAIGGKAAHYAELASIEGVPVPDGFAVPVYFYDQHMRTHGLYDVARALIEDPRFESEPEFRADGLKELRKQIKQAEVDPALIEAVTTQMQRLGLNRARFRSSTNAEDLEGFTGAGLYTSKTGVLDDPDKSIAEAIGKVWASVWFLRAVDERRFRGISHLEVGMALLVHRSFPDEYANGVALTANPFDPSGAEPAFYINVQRGEASVVKPEPGTTTDQILYQYDRPGQPAVYLGRSNSELLSGDEHVLTPAQLFETGNALKAIHTHFAAAYGQAAGTFYAMDVEFKFDVVEDGGAPQLFVKQARPHPGRGE